MGFAGMAFIYKEGVMDRHTHSPERIESWMR